ncbi:MAG TPA: HAD family phosphatase [bacterium]|jgi:HAD superfamily hydrolase (TIGR01509 family)
MIPLHRMDYSPFPLGVIFDLDGTLIDSEALHKSLTQEIARSLSYRLSDEEYYVQLGGLCDVDAMKYLLTAARRTRSAEELVALKLGRYLAHLRAGDVKAIPAVVSYVRSLADLGVQLALATNASLTEANAALELLGLSAIIEIRVSIEMVTRGKPASDIPFCAARHMRLLPSQCLVYEDSVHGVQAAVDAGMAVVGIGRHDPWRLLGAGAMRVMADFYGHELPALPHTLTGESCLT